jgi:hypothetical protein
MRAALAFPPTRKARRKPNLRPLRIAKLAAEEVAKLKLGTATDVPQWLLATTFIAPIAQALKLKPFDWA